MDSLDSHLAVQQLVARQPYLPHTPAAQHAQASIATCQEILRHAHMVPEKPADYARAAAIENIKIPHRDGTHDRAVELPG